MSQDMEQQQEQIPLSGEEQQQQALQGEELRQKLDECERIFKPIFEPYEEDGGIPMRVLRQKLQDEGATMLFPPGKLDLLLKKADTDADGRLGYDEFVRLNIYPETVTATAQVTSDDSTMITQKQLTTFQKMVRGAVSSVVPKSAGEEKMNDYLEAYTCKPPPLFIIIISLAELITFIVYAVELKDTSDPITATTGCPLYSPLVFSPWRRYEAWRYLTYMFIHQGYIHLIFNLIFQLFIGIPLEMVHKWWRVGIVYSLGVIAGSMCHSVFDVNTMLAGASGGCYALIGAHFATIIMNWKEMTYEWMSGPVRFVMSAPVRLFFWTAFAGVDTGLAIYNRYTGGESSVGYAAHFGGALAGLLIGIPVLRNIDEKWWEKIVWWVALVAYLVFVLFAIFWNAFYKGYPETDWRPCCPAPAF